MRTENKQQQQQNTQSSAVNSSIFDGAPYKFHKNRRK